MIATLVAQGAQFLDDLTRLRADALIMLGWIIPRFLMFRVWHWLDTDWPLIAPNFFGAAFSVFLIRQFIMTLPRKLDEAAEIDGAKELGRGVVFPLPAQGLPLLGKQRAFSTI